MANLDQKLTVVLALVVVVVVVVLVAEASEVAAVVDRHCDVENPMAHQT